MYLEERVEQLEILSVDHGRQIETIAKGLADLTITVTHRFDQVDRRFERVEADIAVLKQDVAELKTDVSILKQDVAELKIGQARLETAVADIQQTQQLILSILQNRLQ